jgi:hypothetical protein
MPPPGKCQASSGSTLAREIPLDAPYRRRAMPRRRLIGGVAAMAAASVAGEARASATFDLLLVLAVDASWSVDTARFEMQRQGYADAFRHPRVAAAIASGPRRAIAATMFQWTGPEMQALAVPWTALDGPAAIERFADAIEAAPRRLFSGGTSISGAIDAGMRLLAAAPFRGERRVIDVSGDGANNRGRAAPAARDEAVARGVVINGLPILDLEPGLAEHYREQVIGGPGAFAIAAEDWQSFAAAILNKLVLEIAGDHDPRRDHDARRDTA